MKAADHLNPFFCQLFNAYLPLAYLPSQCKSVADSNGSSWTLITTVFVSATTMLYTSIFLAIVFLWSINRQFHFKHRHSYDTEPLKPLQKARKSIKNAAKRISRNKQLRPGREHDEGPDKNLEEMKLEEQRNFKSFQTFLEDFEDDDEEPTVNVTSKPSFSQRSNANDAVSSPESRKDNHRTKDLLHVASKIEVFSYLSPDAVEDILKYVEYIDFKNIGDVLYDQETLDGSMYAVIQGEVTTHLSVTSKIGGISFDHQSEMNKGFSIVSGPGEVVTSMLTLVTSLVHEYIRKKGDDDGKESLGYNPQMIPSGIEIRAIISSKNTRLLRIPPRCFVTILNKFPKDVHIICQTIIARLQRVTIQTLVRFLGIDVGILGNLNTISHGNIPTQDFNLRLRSEASSDLPAAIQLAASLLGLPAEHSDELENGTSIIQISPGSFLCHKGEVADAVYLILDGYLDVEKTDVTFKDIINNDEGETDVHIKASRTKNFLLSKDGVGSQKNYFEPSFRVERGAWIGLFSSFTNEASFVTTRAPMSEKNSTILLKVPLSTFESIVSRFPSVLIKVLSDVIETISKSYTDCLSSSIFLLDLGLDWMHVEAGQYIASQGERCDSIFVVLNGRLRTKTSKDDSRNQSKQEEFGRGATIGELEALSESQWTYSVYAVRHCEVARIPLSLFNIIMTLSPGAGIHFVST
jgi:CRP-like cAMP-binding protein